VTKTGRAFPFWQSCSLHLAEFVRNPGVPIVGAMTTGTETAIDREFPSSRNSGSAREVRDAGSGRSNQYGRRVREDRYEKQLESSAISGPVRS
jgi:hypothetical protein